MARPVISTTQDINIEDIPEEFENFIWPQLPRNGGNVILAESDTDFGKWLKTQGFKFPKSGMEHLVVYR